MSQREQLSLLALLGEAHLIEIIIPIFLADPHALSALLMFASACSMIKRCFVTAVRNFMLRNSDLYPPIVSFQDAAYACRIYIQRRLESRYEPVLFGDAQHQVEIQCMAVHPRGHLVFIQIEPDNYTTSHMQYIEPSPDPLRGVSRRREIQDLNAISVTDLRFGGLVAGHDNAYLVLAGIRRMGLIIFDHTLAILQRLRFPGGVDDVVCAQAVPIPGRPDRMFYRTNTLEVCALAPIGQPDGTWRVMENLPYMNHENLSLTYASHFFSSAQGFLFLSLHGTFLNKFIEGEWRTYCRFPCDMAHMLLATIGEDDLGRPREWVIAIPRPGGGNCEVYTVRIDMPEGRRRPCIGTCASSEGVMDVTPHLNGDELILCVGVMRVKLYKFFLRDRRQTLDFVCHRQFDLNLQQIDRIPRTMLISVHSITMMPNGKYWVVVKTREQYSHARRHFLYISNAP